MKILITGAKGFIGKNLAAELRNQKFELLEYDVDTKPTLLDLYCKECEFVFHLAGINRPSDEKEFMMGNCNFTKTLLDLLKKHSNLAPVLVSSSIQAALDNPYGQSKKAGEDLVFQYGRETGAKVLVYRLPNVFGKWCKPNYNSVVATFCNNIANDLPIQINDPTLKMSLVYIDDVINEMIKAINGHESTNGDYCEIPVVYTVTLGEVAEFIRSFKKCRESFNVPNMENLFVKKLYSTYLSYLPVDKFSYPLKTNIDSRGSFTEIIRTEDRGQFSVNIIKPGITKGNHWHHSKNEKFLVVSGMGIIRFRKVGTEEIIEYPVSGDKMEIVDIPTGYTHNITNVGKEDLITFMWANESFNPDKPDTYFLEV